MAYKDIEKQREYNRKYKKRIRDDKRKYHLQKTYGLSLEEYNQKVIDQNGRCPICLRHPEKLYVDHNHLTGEIRDLLCRKCNLALGHFYDDKIVVENALNYLKKWNKN